MSSRDLEKARDFLMRNSLGKGDPMFNQEQALVHILYHMEAQQETPASASQPTEQPALSSSEATRMPEVIRHTFSTSCPVSSRVNRAGTLWPFLGLRIQDWLNSLPQVGEALEAEIHLTLTSKASTPPTGSASPSTGEPTREGSGVAGSYDMGPFLEADSYPDSPASSPEPAQGGSEAAARMLNEEATGNTIAQEEQR